MADAPSNQEFAIRGTHDGTDTTRYELWENGVSVAQKTPADLIDGQIEFRRTLTAGTYTYTIWAFGEFEQVESAPRAAIVINPPQPVTDVTIVYPAAG